MGTMDDKKLEELFAPFGKINSARIMVDKATGNSRGFGFVCFTLPEEAEKAMGEMNQKMIGSKPLFVALAQRKEDRKRQLEMHTLVKEDSPCTHQMLSTTLECQTTLSHPWYVVPEVLGTQATQVVTALLL